MWALEHPPRHPISLLADTPLGLLAVLLAALVGTWIGVGLGLAPVRALGVMGVVAGQGALLSTALAWAGGSARDLIPAVLGLALASTLATLGPLGAAAYLLIPGFLAWRLREPRLGSLGLSSAGPPLALLCGLLAGAGLGTHLLLSAARTFGYRMRDGVAGDLLAALAYDVGANVLAAECFFRGALLDRAARRWSFGVAAVLSTAACVVRYLIDPMLPKTAEALVGATFYLSLLGALNAWLRWWSGSLGPALVSGLAFFGAYRLLVPVASP